MKRMVPFVVLVAVLSTGASVSAQDPLSFTLGVGRIPLELLL